MVATNKLLAGVPAFVMVLGAGMAVSIGFFFAGVGVAWLSRPTVIAVCAPRALAFHPLATTIVAYMVVVCENFSAYRR